MKLGSFSCGCVMARGHLKLHRLSFEFDNPSWLLWEVNGWEQLDSVSQSSQHILFLHRDSSPKPFPSAPLQCKQQTWLSLPWDFYLCKKETRVLLGYSWTLCFLMGSFNSALWHFLSEDCRALCLPFSSKLKTQTDKIWFNTEVSCTVSTTLDQAAPRGVFQP